MKHKDGWGLSTQNMWHLIDDTKPPKGEVSFCGSGICTLEHVKDNPYWTGTGSLADLLEGRADAPVCKTCAEHAQKKP